MQIQVTQQEEVRHHGPVNRKKYRGCPWESRKDNQQAAKDEGQKGFPWSSMGTPHPSTDTGSGNDCRTTCREKDWRRDDDRAPKSTHSETVKKDQKVHLYERPMISRTSPQPGNPIKEETPGIATDRREAITEPILHTRKGRIGTGEEPKTKTTTNKPRW
jgi:hypothetical protein